MTLAHEMAGDGPVVVLLHSGVTDRRMWDDQWSALIRSGYRALRCDFRGFGDTPPAAGADSTEHPYTDAGDVLDLLDELGIHQAAFIGSSYGGGVALQVAAARPAAVTSLLLLCAGMPGHEPSEGLLAFGEEEDALLAAGDVEAAVELNVRRWLGPEADEAARERVRTMQRHAFDVQAAAAPSGEHADQNGPEPDADRDPDLSRITAPCLAVSGAHDFTDFRDIARLLPQLLPDATWHEYAWAGHFPNLERPAETTELITAFLARTIPASPATATP